MKESINKTIHVLASTIGHGFNFGRVEQRIGLDFRPEGLSTILFQNFNTDIEHPIVCSLDDPDLPAEYTAEWCKARSQELLDFAKEDFGQSPDGTQKVKTVKITKGNDTVTVTVNPDTLVIPESTQVDYVFMTGNRRGHTLHAKGLTEGLIDEIMTVRVLPFEEAKAIAERENLQKMVGFKGLTKKDMYVMVRDKISTGHVTEEADLYNKLDITRAIAQAVYGCALKGRQFKGFHDQVMNDKIQAITEIKDENGKVIDEIAHTVEIKRFSNKAGIACKGANTLDSLKTAIGSELKPKGVKEANAVSGAEMRKMAESACPVLQSFLLALASGEAEQARQIMVKLSDVEIEFMNSVEG